MDMEKFEKLLFHAPSPKKSVLLVVVTGMLYGLLTSILTFQSFGLWFYLSVLYFTPSLIYAVITNLTIRKFFRRRAFLLGFLNQTFLFMGIVLMTFLPIDPMRMFYGSVAFIYSVNILSFVGISNTKGVRTVFVPWIYILLSALPLTYSILSFTRQQLFLSMTGVFLFGSLTLFLIYLIEFFFQLTVSDSPVKLFSAFLNKESISLDSGIDINTPYQKLTFESNGQEEEISIPWVHPGPGASLGGGALSTKLIDKINEEGKGYFWHVPSSHEQDPAESGAVDMIMGKDFEDEETFSEMTKLHKVQKGSYELCGHRIGDVFLIFVHSEADDYDLSIFRDLKRRIDGDVIFVDRHQHSPYFRDKLLSYSEDGTDDLEKATFELVDKLRDAEQFEMRSAMKVSETGEFMLLAFGADNKKYLYVTLDINGISEDLDEELESIEKRSDFDKVISLTTDAHENIKFLMMEDEIDFEELEDSTESINGDLEESSVTFSETDIDVSVLGKSSHLLETNTKWTLHLFPILLVLHYVILLLFVL